MKGAWITDMTHFLDADGQVPPRPRPIVAFMGSIVSETSLLAPGQTHVLQVRCRRRPGRRPCPATIRSGIHTATREIQWQCPVCGDHGYISGWEGSPWDLRAEPARRPHSSPSLPGFTASARRAWERVPPEFRLLVLNNVWCVRCVGETSIALSGGSVERGDLVLRGSCTRCGGDVARLIEEVGVE